MMSTLSLHDALPISFDQFAALAHQPPATPAPYPPPVRVHRVPLGSLAFPIPPTAIRLRSEEHTSELQSRENLVCRLLLEKKNSITRQYQHVRSEENT